jgi:branched-chain amino acid transport system permease protein
MKSLWNKIKENQAELNPRVRLLGSVILLGIFFILPFYLDAYWTLILGYVGIYVMMGVGLNIVVGYAGLLDIGYVAFYAIGAYTYAMLASSDYGLHYSFWTLIFVCLLVTSLARMLLGIPILRMRGDYLAIVTLGFGSIIELLLRNMTNLTQGSRGIKGIFAPQLWGAVLNQPVHFYYIILGFCVLSIIISSRLNNSRLGRAWIAIREDEDAAELCGVDTVKVKLLAFTIGGAAAGVGGAIFAARQGYVSPDDFTLMVSINVLCLIIIGGMGSLPGVILGSFVLIGLPEVLRSAKEWRMMLFGALLVAMMIFRPEGLLPSRIRKLEFEEPEDSGE